MSWDGVPRRSPNGKPYWRPGDGPPASDDGGRADIYYHARSGPPKIALWIRKRRTAQGLSQADLSRRCGVAQAVVSRWEAGSRIPNSRHMAALRKALGGDPPLDGLVLDR